MKKERLCPHCMKEMPEGEQKICPHCGYDFDNPREITHQLKPFTILEGKYLVGDVLGEGGFGITYIGFDLNLEIRVAIKEFYPNGFATRESQHTSELTAYAGQNMEAVYKWRDSFVKEARSLAKCSHLPGIVGVKDYFQENNTAYIIMEYLEGQTLKEYMKANGGKLPADRVLQVMRPVISSLEEVHKEGLIHRDISPDNLILLKGGNVKLLDFGAARDYTESGERSLSVMLKPGYAPEEQYRTKGKQGPWSDVYALCATIYKCITGVTPPESMERMRQDELTKISSLGIPISPQVETALEKGMAVFAEERCQSMGELENLLYESGNAVPAEAVPNVSQPAPSVTPAEEKVVTETVAAAVQTEEQKEVLQEKKEEQNAGFINKPIEWIKKNKKAVLAVAGIAVLLFAVVKFNGKKDAEDTAQVAANTAENQEQAVSVGAVLQEEEAKKLEEARKQEEEARKQEEEARKQEEEAKKEEEARKQEEAKKNSWKAGYKDFLENDPQMLELRESFEGEAWGSEAWKFALVYMDDDEIPELVFTTPAPWGNCSILLWHDGTVNPYLDFDTDYTGTTCLERKGLVYREGAYDDGNSVDIYRVIDGELRELYNGSLAAIDLSYTWKNVESGAVTEGVGGGAFYNEIGKVYDSTSVRYLELTEEVECISLEELYQILDS